MALNLRPSPAQSLMHSDRVGTHPVLSQFAPNPCGNVQIYYPFEGVLRFENLGAHLAVIKGISGTDRPPYDERIVRALEKIFSTARSDNPWRNECIPHHNAGAEQTVSGFKIHKDSTALAAQERLNTPREAISAAIQSLTGSDLAAPNELFENIMLVYIHAKERNTQVNEDVLYPFSVSSVANVLHTHICREMAEPYEMAEKFLSCKDKELLKQWWRFACNVVDYAPHLLDPNNITLPIVRLILDPCGITERLKDNGIDVEVTSVDDGLRECLKLKLGWNDVANKDFFEVAQELNALVKQVTAPLPPV